MKVSWPFGVALRREASSRLMLRWLKTVVVSDEEKAPVRRQAGAGKTITAEAPELIRWHQNRGVALCPGEESGGCPFTGQAVSGAEVA